MSTAFAPHRSRRRPKLRLVGERLSRPRHATVATFGHFAYVVDVHTFDDINRMTEAERPDGTLFIPGVGWMTIRTPINDEEAEDIRDVNRQAYSDYVGYQVSV